MVINNVITKISLNLYGLFGFFLGDLRPDPPKPRGDFKKTPRAHRRVRKYLKHLDIDNNASIVIITHL